VSESEKKEVDPRRVRMGRGHSFRHPGEEEFPQEKVKRELISGDKGGTLQLVKGGSVRQIE